jgi:hypothetical protein
MNFNSGNLCEICHKPRSLKIHEKCSKIKQANGLKTQKKKKTVNQQKYDNDRKLDGFLKTLGE